MQSRCAACGSFHLGPCPAGRHRAPSRLRTVVPDLPEPRPRRRRLTHSPALETMGFDLPTTPQPPVPVRTVAAPPVRLAPAFTPTRPSLPTRPAPTRPSDRRPTGPSAGMAAIVSDLWDRESALFEHAPDLPAPHIPDIDRPSGPRRAKFAIVIAVVVSAALGSWAIARSNAQAEAGALAAGASDAVAMTAAALDGASGAIADITDPMAAPVALSGAAGTITDLAAAAFALREVATTETDPGFGIPDPVGDRSAFGEAATAATALEDAMGSVLTARLLLDELVELPRLSTTPGDAQEMSVALASAIAGARERADRMPAGHPELAAVVEAGLDDLSVMAGAYAAALRNGDPVGGHLSALRAEVAALDRSIEGYVEARLPRLEELAADLAAALPAG